MEDEDIRQRIIETATEMFNTLGCKGMTMDQLAVKMHISKRTIYEIFDSKEALMQECLAKVYCALGAEKIEKFRNIDEPFLATLFIVRYATMHNAHYSRLLHDAEFYYPELTQKQLKFLSDRLKTYLLKLFVDAEAKGDLRKGVNVQNAINTIAFYVKLNNFNIYSSDVDYPDHLNEICYTYMRGLLSIPAIERYDKNEQKFKNTLYDFEYKN